MSLIFKALRTLGSENENASNPASTIQPQGEIEQRATRSLVVWWIFAGLLGLGTLGLGFHYDIPSKGMSALANIQWLEGQGSSKNQQVNEPQVNEQPANETVSLASNDGITTSTQDNTPADVPQQSDLVVDTPAQEEQIEAGPEVDVVSEVKIASIESINEEVEAPADDALINQILTASDDSVENLGDDVSAEIAIEADAIEEKILENEPQVKVDQPIEQAGEQTEDFVKAQAESPEASEIVEDMTEVQIVQPSNNRVTAETKYETEPLTAEKLEYKQNQQTKAREKGIQISLLTAELIRAVQNNDQTAVSEVIQNMENELGVDSSHVLNMRAYVALANGKFDEVESLLQRVLARDENDVNAGLNMAVAESSTGRVDQARRRLENLVIAHPEDERVVALLQSLPSR